VTLEEKFSSQRQKGPRRRKGQVTKINAVASRTVNKKPAGAKTRLKDEKKFQQRLRDDNLKSKVLIVNVATHCWWQKWKERESYRYVRNSNVIRSNCYMTQLLI